MKPVGQHHVTVGEMSFDTDCQLAKEHFGLHCSYRDMSPVLMPRGYTKRFIDGRIDPKLQEARMLDAWERLSASHPNVVVEGTGHMGVGSIVGLDNGRVASLLGLDVILVCEGGLGSAFDELAMNVAVAQAHKVRLRGVILNKVRPNKAPMLRDYFARALEPLGVPLAGLVPYEPVLSCPAMVDFTRLFGVEFISGEAHQMRHCDAVQLVSADATRFQERLANGGYKDKLLVIHGSRMDVVEAVIRHYEVLRDEGLYPYDGFQGGIIFTGTDRSWAPTEAVLAKLRESNVPTLHAPLETTDAIERIQSYTSKLNATDRDRTNAAIKHMEGHIDFEVLGLAPPEPAADAKKPDQSQITDFL
jgi:dethiobiotin synthetase